MQTLKQPISYYGGKQRMLKHLLVEIPNHNLYCEPFCGGASLFWAKPPTKVEILNDLNRELINFYEVIKTQFEALNELVQATAHSRAHHHFAQTIYNDSSYFDPVRRAWAVYVLANQSYVSRLDRSWGYERKTDKTTKAIINKKRNFIVELANRLELVQLECTTAERCVTSRDCEEAFFYIDPPYPNTHQGHYKGYKMRDFIDLLECISTIKGKFLLSSYDHPELKEWVDKFGWQQKKFVKNLSASSVRGKKKVEVLTANYQLT